MVSADGGVKSVSIVGRGPLGRGLAQAFAAGGLEVIYKDTSPQSEDACREIFARELDAAVARGELAVGLKAPTMERIRISSIMRELADGAVLIEAIPGHDQQKRDIYDSFDRRLPKDRVFITASSPHISRLAEFARRPEQFLGMSLSLPLSECPEVMLIRGPRTGDGAVSAARELVEALGKSPRIVYEEEFEVDEE